MPVLRYQVSLPRDNGLPEDDVVNVWTFDTDQTIAQDADDIAGRLIAFYDSIKEILSVVLTGEIKVKAYELPDPAPGSPAIAYQTGQPVYETTGNIVVPAAQPLPSEMAICVTLLADSPADMPVRNRRGRVFIGPLSTMATGVYVANPDLRADSVDVTMLGNAVKALATGPDAGDGRLAVYSPTWHQGRGQTSGGAPGGPGPLPAIPAHTLDEATNDVDRIQVDNAFDVQRRRGAKATARTTFVV